VARVQANRIWQYHFGAGLVPTPDNFGLSGAPPTHPELLDHLARELTASGWRVKSLHRAILRSSVYRQSSLARPEGLKADAENRLLWRYPLRRLDAEAIRDAMLAASGELDRHPGGPYVPTESGSGEFGSPSEAVVPATAPGANRRSVYLQQRRTRVPTFLALFDAPSIAVNCVERSCSTTPLQSLSQLNSRFAVGRARALAARLPREAGTETGCQVALAFLLTAGREPSSEERADSLRFLRDQRALYVGQKDADSRALADFCQLLFASNLFLYVE
jgi:hypothetical protein